MELVIYVAGKPFGKQRPRFANGRIYTPTKTREYEERIRTIWKAKKAEMMTGYINIYIEANFPVPSYDAKWKRLAKLAGILMPSKPDVDNIGKVVCDALNGLAYPDDSRVTCLTVCKKYSDYEGIKVTITSTDDIVKRLERWKKENRRMWQSHDRYGTARSICDR